MIQYCQQMDSKKQSLLPDKPEVITSELELIVFKNSMDPKDVIQYLINEKYVLIEENYKNGLQILRRLKDEIRKKHKNRTFSDQRKFKAIYREISHRLLIEVVNHKLNTLNSPKIGWLKILYPKTPNFFISFPEIQGLNSSWQWYLNGVDVDVLDLKIHPFYGVYFPTRFDHIETFDNWIPEYKGPRDIAIDVGVGSGILSYMLLQNDFTKVIGTDINKNAIIGLEEEKVRLGFEDRLKVIHGDLFSDIQKKADLVVFNPPWIPIDRKLTEGIDKAIYYNSGLFTRFFDQAGGFLRKDSRLVILFSSLAQITGVNAAHPVKRELEKNNRFTKHRLVEKKVKKSETKTWRRNWRRKESVELWELKLK